MRGKANRCCPARAQPSVLHPGNGRVVHQWLLSLPLRRGRTSTTLVRSIVDVVICSVSGSLAQLALAPLPMLPPAAWSSCGPALAGPRRFEWGSASVGWDPPVPAGAAAIRRCGAGAQVAAVVRAEVEVVVSAAAEVAGEPLGVCYPAGPLVWRFFIPAGMEPESRL
jgi:hypothetical protein